MKAPVRWLALLLAVTLSSSGIVAQQPPARSQGELQRQGAAPAVQRAKMRIGIVLFDRFETLDVFGPVQMWGRLPDYEVVMISEHGAPVKSSQGITINVSYSFTTAPQVEIIMIPGGGGTRTEVNNPAMIKFLRRQDRGTQWTTSVCTGAAVLAKAGILDARRATTNKRAYKWVTRQSAEVQWQGRARWVVDGKYVTSSGVSAGTDMALALVEKLYDRKTADQIAAGAEYMWNDDPQKDPFAVADGQR
jgi:transcriptional regulator GlxA family with amidase domain